jgi:alkylation response protein AidB-like acyl-CoA dehydrogenase
MGADAPGQEQQPEWAMQGFQLGDELESFRREVRLMAEKELAPKAAYWDEHEEFPEANRVRLAELGYFGLLIPEQYGGFGAPIIQSSLFVEEIGRVCFNTATICQLYLHGPSRAITVIGTEEQKKRFLPGVVDGSLLMVISISEPGAGSAITDLRTTAIEDGDSYVLNGVKCFTTLGEFCTHTLVFARFGKSEGARGIGALIVERGSKGFEVGKADAKMGGRGAPECEMIFEDCRVPKENVLVQGDPHSSKSFRLLMQAFGPERCGNAAICVGLAQGAFDEAVKYLQQRQQFSRPLMEFQGLQWKIADMATQIHAARMMVYRAATNETDGFPDPMDTTMAKLYANEMVQRVTNEALQMHGHYGYTRAFPLERMVRDARGYSVAGGTGEILRNTIASMVFGRTFDQRRS